MSRPQGKGIKVKASFWEKKIHINKATEKASQLSKPAVVVRKFALALGSHSSSAIILLCKASVFPVGYSPDNAEDGFPAPFY